MEIPEKFVGSWICNVYQKSLRPDFSFWHEKGGEMDKMIEEAKDENSEIMKFPVIGEEEFTRTINKMKNGKATGIDGISAEIMKFLIRDEDIRNYAVKCFNQAIKEKINEDWLISKTKMLPKNKRPKILEFRPIAVTVNSSKILCSILREKIKDHLKERKIRYENQYGFTKKGRPDHCLFTLDYVAARTYRWKTRKVKPLLYAFIDFKKAYDSINRERLIEVLIKYKINPHIINLIVQMYEGDKTTISLGKLKKTVEVTSGIRHGCSISTLLFKMVTFTIIEEMNRSVQAYQTGAYKGNSLWLADDAVLIADSEETLEKAFEILESEGKKNGLELSEEKTKIVKIRGKLEGKTHIGKYKIEKEAKYLGIQVGGNGSDIYAAENKLLINKAEKKASELMREVKKSCDIIRVGKIIWKMMHIPAIMYG